MIEKMKVVHIVAAETYKPAMLDGLRKLGIVHFAEKKLADQKCLERFSSLSGLAMMLREYASEDEEKTLLSDEAFEKLYTELSDTAERKKTLETELSAAKASADKIRAWGDFSPAEVSELRQLGFDLHFYRLDKKSFETLLADEDVKLIRLATVEKMDTVATLGALPQAYSNSEFNIPEKGLSELEAEMAACEKELESCEAFIKDASKHLPSFDDQMLKAQNAMEYSSVSNSSEASDGLVWLSGYIPEADMEKFKSTAAENNWAWAMGDPADDDENVPTKVRYNKITKLMIPIFDILGTVPGYREYDISFWFLAFFTLFFAMIIGDAGYGCIFLIGALALTLKKKGGIATQLMWLLAIGTIAWGSVTGNWFGLEGAMEVPLLKSLVIPNFANYPQYFSVSTTTQQNSVMKFCFILGTVQLSLACVMNIRKKLKEKDLSFLADVGWLCSICALYFVALFLVTGEEINPKPTAIAVLTGFVLVILFGSMSPGVSFVDGLKAGLGSTFSVFLDTISAFGNIMSYIRLFAVGMASLAIAQSFNDMALGFKGPLIVVGAVIMVIGHALNIVMGMLSVIVHGVRLNLLEFSGQLGMEWAGTAYDPFRKQDKIKK